MDDNHDTSRVELPAAPLRATSAEGGFVDVPVRACMVHGREVHGRLKLLNRVSGVVRIEENPGSPLTEIPFSNLRYICFNRPLRIGSDVHPVQHRGRGVRLPPELQEFHVTFTDGRHLAGSTRSAYVDRLGLHLFQPRNADSVTRLFIPRQVIDSYRFGDHEGGRGDWERAGSAQSQKRVSNDFGVPRTDVAENSAQLLEVLDVELATAAPHSAMRPEAAASPGRVGFETPHNPRVHFGGQSPALDAPELRLAHRLGIPFVNLSHFDVDVRALNLVPVDIAKKYLVIPLFLHHERLVVAISNPTCSEAIDVLRFVTSRHLELAAATAEDIASAIESYYGDDGPLEEEIIAAARDAGSPNERTAAAELREAERLSKERPIVRLANKIIVDAVKERASDIHVRPLENEVDLLYRIDGSLRKIRAFPKGLLSAIISRIKIIGRMNIAERRLPQDGRACVKAAGAVVDLRISVMPTVNGESVVIRLLNASAGLKSINDLDFNARDKDQIVNLLNKTYGLLLVTGPTGSGKSTTLYAALQEIVKQNVNIITVEDPVEYHIDGIEQVHVNTAPGLTFARTLRQILRHDPDVIMIGEIRDLETASIAIESALTGHLVLTTLHTNDAAGAVSRLLEMGIEPFLLNATLLGVLAQRLVRRNCPHCLTEEEIDERLRGALGVSAADTFYRGQGCEECAFRGYLGRLAVYELLVVTPEMHERIVPGASVEAIREYALHGGMVPLTMQALSVARKGLTSLAEVYRVRLS